MYFSNVIRNGACYILAGISINAEDETVTKPLAIFGCGALLPVSLSARLVPFGPVRIILDR